MEYPAAYITEEGKEVGICASHLSKKEAQRIAEIYKTIPTHVRIQKNEDGWEVILVIGKEG